jgi:photosystem II stability/assembly factor-like uncharacterized protein
LFIPTIDPRDPRHVFVACDMTGAYRSTDAGQSWQMFNLGGTIHFFVFDPLDSNTIYAEGIGLWRSTNSGTTWDLVYPDPADVKTVDFSGDHAAEDILLKSGMPAKITALAVDPANSKVLYGSFRNQDLSELRVSADRGKSWQPITKFRGLASRIDIDPRSSPEYRDLYVTTDQGIYVRSNGDWELRAYPNAINADQVALSFPNNARPVVYALAGSEVMVSEDGGSHWRASTLPGSGAQLRAIAVAPANPSVAYVSFRNLAQGLFGFGKKSFGLAKTTDRGKSWSLAWSESPDESAANVSDGWITQFFGPGYGGSPLAIAIAPSDARVVYATDQGRILRSDDAGKNWNQIYTRRVSSNAFTGRGMESTTSYGVHFDPFDLQRMFISYTDIGLFRSENGGESWTTSVTGAPRAWWNTTYWITFDPQVRGRMWAAMSAVHDLPRPKMWQRKSPESYDGGVCISDDGGRTWRKSNEGMLPTAATHVLLDPSSPLSNRVLYVAGFGRGVYKSTDGGRTWSLKNTGIAETNPLAWRLARDSAGVLYLILARWSDDGSIGNNQDGALYRSSDHAEHWTRMRLPAGVNGPNGLAVDPRNARHLLLAAWARNTHPAAGGGVYASEDGGLHWQSVLSQDQHIYDITVDLRNPRIVYAAGFQSSAWRSPDSGKTWKRIPGFNFKWAHRVVPDPRDIAQIYVTTFGSSVWHGPAIGDPEAVDEIATPSLAHPLSH